MKLLVTGAHGLLGRTLLETDWGADAELVGCGRRPGAVGGREYRAVDLTEPGAVRELISRERPDRVIHTAAETNVDLCETDPAPARRINVDAVANLVTACAASGCGLVQLSTDYVFDGAAGPYSEEDETHPLSHYGRMKLASEALVLEGGGPGLVLRTLWLYGHRRGARPNLVTWPLAALARGETVRVVADQWANPTPVADLARAAVELCVRGATGCIHVGGASFMTREELVRRTAAFFQLDCGRLETVTTAEAGQAAARPLRSGLRTERLEGELGWAPADLESGLERMASEEPFRRDFANLVDLGEMPRR